MIDRMDLKQRLIDEAQMDESDAEEALVFAESMDGFYPELLEEFVDILIYIREPARVGPS